MIITDHNLPGFSSDSVLHQVKDADMNVPIIIVSGTIGEETAVQAMKSGASDYIMKGSLARLSPAIKRELRDFELRRQQRKSTETIRYLAYYDPLTQLPNRSLLMDRLQRALLTSTRSDQYGAVIYLDLDNFKNLNDTKGHHYGDEMLKQVAERLKANVREQDTVARLGGDEFVVMLENIGSNADQAAVQAKLIGDKIVAALNATYTLKDYDCHSSCSVGVALFHGGESQLDTLLTQADTSMYEAKKAGRNTLRFFDPTMQEALDARVGMEEALRQALDKKQFQLFYQVQVTDKGHVVGMEALIRWVHPEKGVIPPADFVPLAENVGLINTIGTWVLETACAQMKALEKLPTFKGATMSVNVSASQFKQENFVGSVHDAVYRSGISPSKLKLELTESVILEDAENAIAKMNQLKSLGITLSLDDFGTGYSSLNYLRRLPLGQIKIDRSFVVRAVSDPSDAFIVRMVIKLGKMLGMSVIAEGVESSEQYEFLKRLGCKAFQGYFFGRPVPGEELERFLQRMAMQ